MRAAAFLVMPSVWYEGFPMTIAESFACGTPVICSKLGAMQEIVEHQRTGLHFTPDDAADLQRQVEYAASHPTEMAAMGKAARREYELHYTAQTNYEMLMNIYATNHRFLFSKLTLFKFSNLKARRLYPRSIQLENKST